MPRKPEKLRGCVQDNRKKKQDDDQPVKAGEEKRERSAAYMNGLPEKLLPQLIDMLALYDS